MASADTMGDGKGAPAIMSMLGYQAGPATMTGFSDEWMPHALATPSRSLALALALCVPVWLAIGSMLFRFFW